MNWNGRFDWTDAAVVTLRDLAKDANLSAADIGQRMGIGRNAVIGKCGRLGIALPRAGMHTSGDKRVGKPQPRGEERNIVIPPAERAKPVRPAPIARQAGAANNDRKITQTIKRAITAPSLDATEAIDLPPEVIAPEQRKTLFELTEDTCRWPIGHPTHDDFHFCGAQPRAGGPYCAGHSRLAYETPSQRKARIAVWAAQQKARAA